MARFKYKSKCHLVVDGVGHVWPDTEENRAMKRRVECELDEDYAKSFGSDLIQGKKVGNGKSDDNKQSNKQVTETATK